MPRLAPIGTPPASGPIDSQDPNWQSSLARRSAGAGFTFGRALDSKNSPRKGLGVRKRMCLAGADPRDAVLDGANAGGQEPRVRRVPGDGGIKDDRGADDVGVAEQFLRPGAFICDAGDGAERAGRELSGTLICRIVGA